MELDKLKITCDEIGYEKVIKHLKHIQQHMELINLDSKKVQLIISELEKDYNEDFWSGWTDYEKTY
jgi:uncharacterized protein YihD (DUF1040 family)